MLAFTTGMEPFIELKDQLQIRVEGRRYNIFCKDSILLENIYNAVAPWVQRVSGPTTDEELNYMLDNGHRKILRDVLPKNMYQYRIYFKESWDIADRNKFLAWIMKNSDIVDVSKSSKEWLQGDKRWIYNPFVYVKDNKTMTIVGLYTSGSVKRVEEFILRENLMTA